MKHTDLYHKWQELQWQELRELKAAVEAHGGKYVFFDCDQENADEAWDNFSHMLPVVLADTKYAECLSDYLITKVEIDEGGNLGIYGVRYGSNDLDLEEHIDHVAFTHVSFITDMISETNDVKNVSEGIQSLPVLLVSREDLESLGFKSDIPNAMFEKLADYMSKYADMENFWMTLEYAAEQAGIPKKTCDHEEA